MNANSGIKRGVVALGLGMGILTAIAPAQAKPAAMDAVVEPVAQGTEQQLVLPFSDVSPDHWAYEALLNLAGVYGCVSGYPDGTFRGEDTVTRHEFAAGMDSCLSVLTNLAQQQQQTRDQEVRSLIDAMEQSLSDLREIESDLPAAP
ncbi:MULTISPECIES: S-layer homology domain-containing protein [Cyanophyceae]|uniref:S-layer homology domain-containing protein n=1 Tax=Cyanophyceae TaxID=3028117 RepID=UPI0016881B19|nr:MULTISPECIES: S-layer homology domain-containing protein [Cyanophyceae]MBD1914470.1 S-layer homology domain-containing protein [Phormidium sp. FACHB-77]MBD2031043.1 S-layer homology domain-containing protein [Phormidium sp. FACHB-322]MBD2052124.1 S-layer homology domain-containing protein [Leptolyngbya sp. FACHB-60]